MESFGHLIASIEPIAFVAPPDNAVDHAAWLAAARVRMEAAMYESGLSEVRWFPIDRDDLTHDRPEARLVGQAVAVLGTTGLNRKEAWVIVSYTASGKLRVSLRPKV